MGAAELERYDNTEIILPNATDAELQAMCDYRSPSLSWLLDS